MNYNSIEEIFSAGTTNMTVTRNNIKQDDNTDIITGVDWFTYNGNVVSEIHANGNSWIGFGADSEHLQVNRRDGALYSLYREEGTLYNYYKFLKIRWDGYSYYNRTDSSHKVTYDVILWDTGDISLHMINIPTSYNSGNYYLVASSGRYSYTVSTSFPDVTFKKTDSGFEVSNSVVEIKKIVKTRYLVHSESDYYTVVNDSLSKIEVAELNSNVFLTQGVEYIPSYHLLVNLTNPEIIYWAEDDSITVDNLQITGFPTLPQLAYYDAITIPEWKVVANVEASSSDDVLYSITVDNGLTWKYYNNGWLTVNNDYDGMTRDVMNNLKRNQWIEVITSSNFQIRCALLSLNSVSSIIAIRYGIQYD